MKLPRKKAKKVKKNPRRRRRSSEANALGVLFVIALAVLSAVNFNAAVLILLGLLPTIVLGFTGKGQFKADKMQCVSMANISGVVMLFPGVWSKPSSFETVLFKLDTWVIMWGSAAIGYALIYIGPVIAAMILQGLAQDRIKKIAVQRQELVEAWGADVLPEREDEKVDPGKAPVKPEIK